eukprot:11392181-Heterocapsa_arctica.AAC.1
MGTHANEGEDISGIGEAADLEDNANGGYPRGSRPRNVNVKSFSGDRRVGIYSEWRKDVLVTQMAYA